MDNKHPPYGIYDMPTLGRPRTSSISAGRADSYILSKSEFGAYRNLINAEVTKLQRVALKCVLADPRAVGKPYQACREAADKQLQRQFDVIENSWRARNPKALFDFESEPAGEIAKGCQASILPSESDFEYATLRQYGCITSGMAHQIAIRKELSQLPQTELLAHVNRIGMRKHLSILKQWNVEWQRRADERVEQGNRFWHCGHITIDVSACEETFYPEWERILSRMMVDAAASGDSKQKKSVPACRSSSEDTFAIDKLAAEMACRTSQEDKAAIRAAMGSVAAQQGEEPTLKGGDPLPDFFHAQAVKAHNLRKESSDKKRLGAHGSTDEPQGQAQSTRRPTNGHPDRRAPLAEIEVPNGARARARLEVRRISNPQRRGGGKGNFSTGSAPFRHGMQKPAIAVIEKGAKPSCTRSKTWNPHTSATRSGSLFQIFEDPGREVITALGTDEVGDTIVIGGVGGEWHRGLADHSPTQKEAQLS